jgi:hypothetical protein
MGLSHYSLVKIIRSRSGHSLLKEEKSECEGRRKQLKGINTKSRKRGDDYLVEVGKDSCTKGGLGGPQQAEARCHTVPSFFWPRRKWCTWQSSLTKKG